MDAWRWSHLLLRFGAPLTTSVVGVRFTRIYHLRHLPPMGLRRPSTVFSSNASPTLFRAGTISGVQRAGNVDSWHTGSSEGEDSVRSFSSRQFTGLLPSIGAESLFRFSHSFPSPLPPRHFSRIACKQAFRETIRRFRFEPPEQPARLRATASTCARCCQHRLYPERHSHFPLHLQVDFGPRPEQ